MALVPLMINLACSNVDPRYGTACNKAMEAGTKQTQILQYDEKAENYFTMYAQRKATDYMGQDTMRVIGGVVYVYKIEKARALSFRLPTLGLCSEATNSITPSSYKLDLKWNFPWK